MMADGPAMNRRSCRAGGSGPGRRGDHTLGGNGHPLSADTNGGPAWNVSGHEPSHQCGRLVIVSSSRAIFLQLSQAADVTPVLRDQLVACWVEVTNAGGAVGFPFPPVRATDVSPVLDQMTGGLTPSERAFCSRWMAMPSPDGWRSCAIPIHWSPTGQRFATSRPVSPVADVASAPR